MSTARSQRLIIALISGIRAHEGRRITDYQIAEYLRVRPATLSKWMNGRTQLEQVEWLLRLLDRLPEDRWLREFKDALKEQQVQTKRKASRPNRPAVTKRPRDRKS
jgi:transcriptional regulator with XRE-family HTH domain